MIAVPVAACAQTLSQQPRYRHIDPSSTAPADLPQGIIRLLADEDFAPYSFTAADGSQAGFTVDLARQACAELRLACEVVPLPFAQLMPALQRGNGDVIISGLRPDPAMNRTATMTRPVYVSVAAFFRHKEMASGDISQGNLTGKRLGFVRGSSHGAYVERYFPKSVLQPYENTASLFAALKTKELDAAFADALAGSFWIRGSESAGCCERIGKPYVDRNSFSMGLAFVVRNDRKFLREALDFALDRLEENGTAARVMDRYLPEPLW